MAGLTVEERLQVEREIVGRLIDMALDEGWKLDSVWDGEEDTHVHDKEAALDTIFAVDESTLTFFQEPRTRRSVLIVLGNGVDVISDYSSPDPERDIEDFNGLMERHGLWVEGRYGA